MDNPTTQSGPPAGGGKKSGARARFAYLRWPRGRRRAMAAAATVALTGLVALPVIALTSSSPSKLHSALVFTGPAATTTAVPDPTTSTTVAPATTLAPASTTTVAPVRQATTTTTLVCRNSYNPECGPFHWDPAPAPGGSPSVTIVPSTPNPTAGEGMNFKVTVSDPDTAVYTCGQVQYGDMSPSEGCAPVAASCPTRYGAWDPPARHPDSATTEYPHTYKDSGTYTFSVVFPVGNPCFDPYEGQVSGSVTVTVSDPTPSTT